MANLNAGTPLKFENGGIINFATDVLLAVVEGTGKIVIPVNEPMPHMDRGVLTSVVAGNQRMCEVEFDVKCTGGATGVPAFFDKLMGAKATNKMSNVTAAGLIFTFPMTIKVPDYLGAATGWSYAFTACYAESGLDIQFAAGTNFDTLKVKLKCNETSPTIVTY